MRQYDIVYDIGLQRDGGRLAHHAHPISEAGFPKRLVGMVGVEWRQFPQRLLPPHAADQKAKDPVADVFDRALAWDRAIDIDRDRDAAEHKKPEDDRRPSWLKQEGNN